MEGKISIIRYHGRRRKEFVKNIKDCDIVITTYRTLAVEHGKAKDDKENSFLHSIAWYRVVLDEGDDDDDTMMFSTNSVPAHWIRRVPTTFHRATTALTARFRWCLSGTPIQNSLDDLAALLVFTQIKPFDNISVFRSLIANPFEDSRRKRLGKDRLTDLLEALCLRRTIDSVDVPGQREQTRSIDFTTDERRQYEDIKQAMNKTLIQRANERWNPKSISGMFQIYLQLRILCNHGTYQQRHLWVKADLLDAEEDAVCSLTRDSFNRCSNCREPLPVLFRDRSVKFVERCKHILCRSCVEKLLDNSGPDAPKHCPLCEPLGGPAIPLRPSEGALLYPATRENRLSDTGYFHETGRSSKIDAVVADVSRDLGSTKR